MILPKRSFGIIVISIWRDKIMARVKFLALQNCTIFRRKPLSPALATFIAKMFCRIHKLTTIKIFEVLCQLAGTEYLFLTKRLHHGVDYVVSKRNYTEAPLSRFSPDYRRDFVSTQRVTAD